MVVLFVGVVVSIELVIQMYQREVHCVFEFECLCYEV